MEGKSSSAVDERPLLKYDGEDVRGRDGYYDDDNEGLPKPGIVVNDDEAENDANGQPYREPEGGYLGAIFNVANTALGAGILAFPYAFEQSGLALGMILVAFVCMLCAYSQEMIVMGILECKDREARGGPFVNSYDGMIRNLLGPAWGTLMEILIALYQFGACVAYVLVFADQLEPLLKCAICGGDCCSIAPNESESCDCDSFWCNQNVIIIIATWALMFPPCLFEDISKLRYTSMIGVFCPLIMSIVIIYYGIVDMVENGVGAEFDNVEWFTGDVKGAFAALPIFCFALQTHISVPCIFTGCRYEIQNKSTFSGIIFKAYMIVLALYIPTGLFGLTYFVNNTHGEFPKDVLTGFKMNKILADVARVCMAGAGVASFPINHFPARAAIFNIIYKQEKMQDIPNRRKVVVIEAVIFCACACGLAIAVPNVAVVFGVLGATVASSSMFIFPGLILYLFVTEHDFAVGSPNLSIRSPRPMMLKRQTSTFKLPKNFNGSIFVGIGYILIGVAIAGIGTYASLL
eukprot:g2724.t1